MEGPTPSTFTRYRLLEMLPAALIWGTFAAVIVLAISAPTAAVVFIVGFDLLWLTRILYTLGLLLVAYGRFRASVRVPWHRVLGPAPDDLWHVIILPTYGEGRDVIEGSLAALSQVRYRTDRLFIVLATEGREAERIQPIAEQLRRRFGDRFGQFLVTVHPQDLPGELAGKGSNIAWAGRRVAEILEAKRIRYDRVLVTTLDVDSIVHPEYFAHLTYRFGVDPNPLRTSYQPIPIFANNLEDAPLPVRVVAMATTFWLLGETVRPERLFTFSSHSMSFQALVDVGFWQSDIVTEDSRIFVQALLRYDGDYRVAPLYLPVSMDAVQGRTVWESLIALYKQQRRWAYGVENFPFMAWNFSANPKIPRRTKFRYLFNQLEGVYSWATAPIVIFVLGWLPLRFATSIGSESAFVQAAPVVLHWLLTFSLVGLGVCASLTLTVLGSTGRRRSVYGAVVTVLSWALFPIAMLLFGSIPATDAATRLALGNYLGFNVTTKVRRLPQTPVR